MAECFGCRKPRSAHPLGFANTEVVLSTRVGAEADAVRMPYCPDCAKKIMRLDRDLLCDGIQAHIESLIGTPSPRRPE
mgnify:CR=1 FL=1